MSMLQRIIVKQRSITTAVTVRKLLIMLMSPTPIMRAIMGSEAADGHIEEHGHK
jgi:hypothetical protein